jgi:hypothetical protein
MKKLVLFKMFLEKYDKEKKLLKYLTDNEIKKLNSLPSFSKRLDSKKFFQDSIIDNVHYSWFIPLLNIYSLEEASLFLLAMKPSYRKPLKNLLNLEEIKDDINPFLKEFLRSILLRSLIKKEDALLPIECLFESKLNILLTLSKNELVKLIDLLSMYDLARELKYIVEKEKLKKIYSYLKPIEKAFLKITIHHSDSFSSQRILIEKYINDKTKFRNIFHIRGLMRLSIALSGENIDLIWYVCHYLDIGRGNYIFKKCKKEKIQNVSDIITTQILKIINFFKENKEKT